MYDGWFNDGRTAARHVVIVNFARHGLDIRDRDDSLAMFWPYADLRLVDATRAAPLRLARRLDPAPRLSVADPVFRKLLFEHAPALDLRRSAIMRGTGTFLGGIAGACLFVAALWYALPLLAKPIAMMLPDSFEERLGSQVFYALVEDAPTCEQPEGRDALDRLVDRLASAAGRPDAFGVAIVNRPIANAFAAPGGYIVVFAGFVAKMESADELAGVLAHEMGHIVHRHTSQALVRQFAVATVLTIVTGNDWGFGRVASGLGRIFLDLGHSREDEAEADATALDILKAAQIDGAGEVRLFARLENEQGPTSGFDRYLSTHPPAEERRAAAERADVTGGPAMTSAEWAALKAICDD